MEKVELLAPAGDLERLKIAFEYGADAVYLGGENFGMRTAAKNFTIEDIKEGAEFAHERGKRIFVTVNIIPHSDDFEGFEDYIKELDEAGVDALIASDPGVIQIIRDTLPNMELHISTQANTTNYQTANFWYRLGAKRVVVARELSFDEVKEIREHAPEGTDIEAFVHGAMCISYSGRCLISNYMTGRDANRGSCAQSCRWKYNLVEEKRPGEYFPVYEDERGTFFFNSKDLCMIEYIPQIIDAGITSLKIEGRMKTAYYVATVVRAYRMALDEYYKNPQSWKFNPMWLEELKKGSHRHFTTGFFNEKPDEDDQNYASASYVRNYDFVGLVVGDKDENGFFSVEQRNKMVVGDNIEIIGPFTDTMSATIKEMLDEEGNPIEAAPHPRQIVKIKLPDNVGVNFMLRKEIESKNIEE
ncbi:peptidase U32 family protein [Peptostreptococcus equinus]|uniref:U32 family peptidase n=1 Tax=Peptostreptococcus equinus TaxID=3003601 RepID=A0ABY7JUQ4_9FIRM|nr:U32 family peptidase [Peptostreptococcus sp. CBA3647]WAW15632.1 U32 family peptidase [Peptostreptococcus sp. CBA3647]